MSLSCGGGDEPSVRHRPDVHVRDHPLPWALWTHRQERTSLHSTLWSGLLAVWGGVYQQVPISYLTQWSRLHSQVSCLVRKSKTSHQDINDMGLRARKEGKKLIIFPEGTRNGAKGLTMLPFKKGTYSQTHALQTQNYFYFQELFILQLTVSCPYFLWSFLNTTSSIVGKDRWDRPAILLKFLLRKMIFKPGKVTIKVLPRIESSDYSKDNIDELVSHTRWQAELNENLKNYWLILFRNVMIESLREISKIKSE